MKTNPKIVVLGDLILDQYTWGNAERVSPEAPVMVLKTDQRETRLGGAASVAGLLRDLEMRVSLVGVVGNDTNGRILQKLLDESGIGSQSVLTDALRPTTTKERFIGRAAGRHPHQMLRVDDESSDSICEELESTLLEEVRQQLADCQVLLISDYAKGVCTPHLLQRVIDLAHAQQIPVLIDPAAIDDFSRYRGADLLKPNRLETSRATGQPVETPEAAWEAATQLCEALDLPHVLVTLDSQGMVLVGRNVEKQVFPTQKRAVYDITGAGDTVLAVLGFGWATGIKLDETIVLANQAAGLQIEHLGVVGISRDALLAERPPETTSTEDKLVSLDQMAKLSQDYRLAGKKVVFTNGCFDLLHIGHVTYLQQAAALGDVLIVAVNSDASVSRLKGPDRPVIGQQDRAALLSALACVDHVLIFDEATPHQLLREIRPDVLVKGGTYTLDEVIGKEIVFGYGGNVRITGQIDGVSTTDILASMKG